MGFTNKTYLVSAKIKVSGVFKPLKVQVQAEDIAGAEIAAMKKLPENSIIVHTERMLGKDANDRRAGLHRALDCVLDHRAAKDSTGTIHVNMSQMKKWKVDSDNVRYYDSIMRTKGVVVTLDTRPYEELLNEFGIFYTAKR